MGNCRHCAWWLALQPRDHQDMSIYISGNSISSGIFLTVVKQIIFVLSSEHIWRLKCLAVLESLSQRWKLRFHWRKAARDATRQYAPQGCAFSDNLVLKAFIESLLPMVHLSDWGWLHRLCRLCRRVLRDSASAVPNPQLLQSKLSSTFLQTSR